MNIVRITILLLCIMISMLGCQLTQKNNPTIPDSDVELVKNLDFEAQYIRTNGYTEAISYPVISLIQSTEELNEYYLKNKDIYNLEKRAEVLSDLTIGFLDAVEKYDDAYFNDSVLVLLLLEEGSGSIRHQITDIKRNEGFLEIYINKLVPNYGTDDMAQWHIIVELKKDTIGDSEIKVVID
jgi:hypothetical protein